MQRKTLIIVITLILLGILSVYAWRNQEIFHIPQASAALNKELSNVELETEGVIPGWLNGTLVRNGPVNVSIEGKTNEHWFDGLAMLHSFDFLNGKIIYNNKFLKTDAYRKVFQEGSLNYSGFRSVKSPETYIDTLTIKKDDAPKVPNANINVGKIGNNYVALTEVPPPVKFDLKTLNTLGILTFEDSLNPGKYWVSAHPHYDKRKKEMINFNVVYGSKSFYQIYRIKDGSLDREVIAEIPVEKPAYMQSFSVTKNYIILTEYPFVVDPKDLLKGDKPFINNFVWEPQNKTRFIVVDRKDGKIIGKYLYKPFFAFHHANAFEKNGSLYLDIITYETPKIIYQEGDEFRIKPAMKREANLPGKLERFSLDLKTGEMESKELLNDPADFPGINPLRDGRSYKYLYVVDSRDIVEKEENRPIYKVNTNTKEVTRWAQAGSYPGEPVFVAKPNGEEEDDGVILSLVFDNKKYRSYLLILDAKNMTELGKVIIPHIVPPGLNGEFFGREISNDASKKELP